MAFPVVEAFVRPYGGSGGEWASQTDTIEFDLPAGIAAGQTLIIIAGCREGAVNDLSGWTTAATAGGSLTGMKVFYKKADGTEGGTTVVVTYTATSNVNGYCMVISGAADPDTTTPEAVTAFQDSDGLNPDPPNLTPTGGAKDYLWITGFFVRNDADVTAYPSSYLDGRIYYNGSGSDANTMGFALKDENVASDNPGSYTISQAGDWSTATIAVHPVGGGGGTGTDQDVTLVSGQQSTQALAADVNQVALINAIIASQRTQSQASTVDQVAALSSAQAQQVTEAEQSSVALTALLGAAQGQQDTESEQGIVELTALLGAVEAQQVTEAVSVDINTAAVMDITAVMLQQITQAEAVTVQQAAEVAGVVAQQLTQGVELSTEQIADLAAVVVEQFTQAQAVDVSVTSPNELVVSVIEQLTQAQAITAGQSAEVTGLSAESVTASQAVGIAADYSLVAVTGEQLTQAQALDILDGTGLSVVTLEQSNQAQAATVTLIALVNGISVETRHESSTVATAATMLVTANQAEQLTEADIADILGSALELNPRELSITRTTAGFQVRRTTPVYGLQFKHSIH